MRTYMIMMLDKTQKWLVRPLGLSASGLFQVTLIGALLSYLYAPVLSHLVSDWWIDPDYSHGFLIPVLSIYFLWERRLRLANVVRQPSPWGVLLLLMGLLILLVGTIGAELFLVRVSLVMVITALVCYLLGWEYLKVLSFPIALLLLMIPLPAIIMNTFTLPLQILAARASTHGLQLLGLPVLREGNLIYLPRLTLEVVEACSGIRSLVSLTALAVVFAYLTQRNIWKQSALVISAVPIAIGVNAFRIWSTGVLGHVVGMKIADDFYHAFTGWLVFVVAFVVLLGEGFVLSRFRLKRPGPREVTR